ncbi:uncharacterized protein EV422DRAFT_545895 [Fimicolochytrium jonesii]|uniref:uncharacterized protein n=1 Tax=Fimicolochytrium jonesii TaxID=1396493 RepID=UPI0022FE6A16|nr:uncharacterized protein EV422DRAFT_545895 [Fimicolochytrium jonesii]KAI8816400.1 hypothetical protein EV422DRAFT_545895 [Fimicolochytrium jonesii]
MPPRVPPPSLRSVVTLFFRRQRQTAHIHRLSLEHGLSAPSYTTVATAANARSSPCLTCRNSLATTHATVPPIFQTRHFSASASNRARHKNHYEVLSVGKGVDKKTLKAQFYKLSKKYHPDRNPGDTASAEKFVEINEAYSTLSDDSLRRAHDRDIAAHAPIRGGPSNTGRRSSPFSHNPFSNRTDAPVNPNDWILFRRRRPQHPSSGAHQHQQQRPPGASRMYDFDAHQKEHYGSTFSSTNASAFQRREEERQQRLFKTLYFRELQRVQKAESKMVTITVITGLTIFFVFHSGLVQMIWLDDAEYEEQGGTLRTPTDLPSTSDASVLYDWRIRYRT